LNAGFRKGYSVGEMQLSDREIQNTIDLLRKRQPVDEEFAAFSMEEMKSISDVIERIEVEPEVRKDRVEKVRKAIETSSYNITGDEIAKKLIGRIFSDKLR